MSDAWPLFIGRFQPFHRGHMAMVRQILREHEGVRFGIGSAQYSDTPSNPFSFEERAEMITATMDAEGVVNYDIVAIEDLHNDQKWISLVMQMLPNVRIVYTNDSLTKGLFRDRGIDVRVMPLEERDQLSGTEVRRRMLEEEDWETLVPDAVREVLARLDAPDRLRLAATKSDAYENEQH